LRRVLSRSDAGRSRGERLEDHSLSEHAKGVLAERVAVAWSGGLRDHRSSVITKPDFGAHPHVIQTPGLTRFLADRVANLERQLGAVGRRRKAHHHQAAVVRLDGHRFGQSEPETRAESNAW